MQIAFKILGLLILMNTYINTYIATLVLIGLSNLDILIPELDILREVFLQTQSDCGDIAFYTLSAVQF